nr:unnamed protein product [Trichobilharzia regenti]
MSSAEMHYAYKLFNHLCEYTIELLVNKLISNQAEYIHHNEVNKQILNFVQLKHSTNCDLLFNETKLTNTNTNEYNSNPQFNEMIWSQIDRSNSSNCNPIDLSQKVDSPSHLDMSTKSVNKCSNNWGDLPQKNHYISETMNNNQSMNSHSEEMKSNDIIDLTSGTKAMRTSPPATTHTSSNSITYKLNSDQSLLYDEKRSTKDSHRPMNPNCTNDQRQVTLRSQNQSMKEVQNSSKMHASKTPAINSIQFKLIPVDRTGMPLKTPGLINNTHKLYISSPFPIGNNISSIYLMPKNMTSFINPTNNVSSIQQTLNLLHQNRRDDSDGDAYVDVDNKGHVSGGIHDHHHYKEDNDTVMKDEINNVPHAKGEKERCSTCNLSFKHPIDFFKHIQMVHVGLQFRNRVNLSKYPEKTIRTSPIKRHFPTEHLKPSKSKPHHADNDSDNNNNNNNNEGVESDINNYDNNNISNEGNDKVNDDDNCCGVGGGGGDDDVGDDHGNEDNDDDDEEEDDGDEDMKEEDNDEYIPVKSTLCNTRQRPYEFRRMKKSESLTG